MEPWSRQTEHNLGAGALYVYDEQSVQAAHMLAEPVSVNHSCGFAAVPGSQQTVLVHTQTPD